MEDVCFRGGNKVAETGNGNPLGKYDQLYQFQEPKRIGLLNWEASIKMAPHPKSPFLLHPASQIHAGRFAARLGLRWAPQPCPASSSASRRNLGLNFGFAREAALPTPGGSWLELGFAAENLSQSTPRGFGSRVRILLQKRFPDPHQVAWTYDADLSQNFLLTNHRWLGIGARISAGNFPKPTRSGLRRNCAVRAAFAATFLLSRPK